MDILREEGVSVITKHTLPIIEELIKNISLEIADVENLEVGLKRFADLLIASELIKNADVNQINGKCLLDIDGCIFAEHVHNMLKPKDVTCPWAIIGMTIAQKIGERKVKINLSEFDDYGSKTLIEFL